MAACFYFIVMIAGLFYSINSCNNYVEDMESMIGKKIVLGTDSLIVVDYSSWSGNFILSNGIEVNLKILEE